MNIIDAIEDPNLFGPFLGHDLSTWRPWLTALRVMYGLDIADEADRELVLRCTGRDSDRMPPEGFNTALFLTGRRSGKSRDAALVGAFEAALGGHETKLSKGERGIVPVLAPTKAQAVIVHGYLRSIFDTPLLRREVIGETRGGFDLRNGISVVVLAGDWRTVRGFTLLCAVLDEACFLGVSEESKVRSDTELIRALRPGLATTRGRLVVISSPYARKGWCFTTYEKNFGNERGSVLVWNAPSRVMNPTLPQSVVDEAMAEDLQAAKSEYLGEFRDDVAAFIDRAVVEALVVADRKELLPSDAHAYSAFVDVSGGRGDDSALAIAHRKDGRVVLDLLRNYRPPHNPHEVIADMSEQLKRFGIERVTGDNYAADFVATSFEAHGLRYTKATKPKAALYLELLPRLCSGGIELLDHEVAVAQLAALERRTRSGGKDLIDHPRGGHDDVANVIAGVAEVIATPRVRIGALFSELNDDDEEETHHD